MWCIEYRSSWINATRWFAIGECQFRFECLHGDILMLERNVVVLQRYYRYFVRENSINTKSPTNFAYAHHVGYIAHKKHRVAGVSHVRQEHPQKTYVSFFPHPT